MPETLSQYLSKINSSYLILGILGGVGAAAGLVFYSGLLGRVLQAFTYVTRGSIRRGFLVWEILFAWLSWPWLLGLVIALIVIGRVAILQLPALTFVCALAPLVMGLSACLAYMFIDMERYEVERGFKAIHNPLKGQELALDLARYGHQVGVPLLATAAVSMIGGFALLNHAFYETIGANWYDLGSGRDSAAYIDFLVYTIIHLLHIVDVLNLARSHQLLSVTYIRQAAWPAATMLTSFQTFFAFVLLQQIFASVRQASLLGRTITDFWSPHASISERARDALPQYGARATGPFLLSLRSVLSLTKEQRDQLPGILASIGPAAIPALVRHLKDPHEHMRATAVGALGLLHARNQVPLLVKLADDPSEVVRQSLVQSLGVIGSLKTQTAILPKRRRRIKAFLASLPPRLLLYLRPSRPKHVRLLSPGEIAELCITTLRTALADKSPAVRLQSAHALGLIGTPASAAVHGLISLLHDADETVRCEAAAAVAKVGGDEEATVSALIELLQDASVPVKAAAADALGGLKTAAAPAVPALAPLLQNQDESVRTAAAEAIAQVGTLTEADTDTLSQGLTSKDNVVRAQTAEALGTIGASAQEAAGALVEAVTDNNDVVRAKAVEALGKIGAGAADIAVPSLVRALRDQDNWVSALAAEALGQMGDSADEAVPALMRTLRHMNPQVRANATESLGKMGILAARARPALEQVCRDSDGGVRAQAVRALGMLGTPIPTSIQAVLEGLQDGDPQVRTAAVEAIGRWDDAKSLDAVADSAISSEQCARHLMPLLQDANDQVKVQVIHELPKFAGAAPTVIDGLCLRLLEDDSILVQFHAAQALSKLGAAGMSAGPALLRAAQTAEVTVREQAMRAIAMIQPKEAEEAFASGLKDDDAEIRKMASAGWMKSVTISESVIPALVEALRDPEAQVRSNAAHALARLETLPAAAVPLLVACTTDANDGLRINAALALKLAPAGAATEAMQGLLEDANVRIRLIAAGSLLQTEAANPEAVAVLVETLNEPTARLREVALDLIESLGASAAVFLDPLRLRISLEDEPRLLTKLSQLVRQIELPVKTELQGA